MPPTRLYLLIVAVFVGGCSLVVDFDRSLLLDGGTDGDEGASGTVEDDDSCVDADCREPATDIGAHIATAPRTQVYGGNGCAAPRAPSAVGLLLLWIGGAALVMRGGR